MKQFIGIIIMIITTVITVFYGKLFKRKKKSRYDDVKPNPKFYKETSIVGNCEYFKKPEDDSKPRREIDISHELRSGYVNYENDEMKIGEPIPDYEITKAKTVRYVGKCPEDVGVIYSPYVSGLKAIKVEDINFTIKE